jgi:WD40 repeat protein
VRWGLADNTLLTGSSDGAVRLWDTQTLQLLKEVKVEGAVMDLEVSRTMQLITVAAGTHVTFLDGHTLDQVSVYVHYAECCAQCRLHCSSIARGILIIVLR